MIGVAVGLTLLGLLTAFLLWRAVRAQGEPDTPEGRLRESEALLAEVRQLCRTWTGSAEGLARAVEARIAARRAPKRP